MRERGEKKKSDDEKDGESAGEDEQMEIKVVIRKRERKTAER